MKIWEVFLLITELFFIGMLIVFWNYHQHDPSYHQVPTPVVTHSQDYGRLFVGKFPEGAFK